MTHGSLFSGIGGFDLAAEWMGWENVFHCEYDHFCQKVLKHHFPNSKLYKDVRTFDATDYAGRIDLLSGGFPCQPFSTAGLRKGTEDERNLWGEMLRIIREVSPRYVVGENVRGLLNWGGGVQFEQVCIDLENEGYKITPYLLPACGKNAPHRRDRIWFIANSTKRNGGRNTRSVPSKEEEERICERNEVPQSIESGEVFGDAPDTDSWGRNEGGKRKHNKIRKREVCKNESNNGGKIRGEIRTSSLYGDAPDTLREGHKRSELDGTLNKGVGTRKPFEPTTQQNKIRNWEQFPTQPPICGGDDGLPKELDGITLPKWRNESIKAYGNAIVPQVAHEIFKAIQKMEDLDNKPN